MKKIALIDSVSAEVIIINNIEDLKKKVGFNDNEHDIGTFVEGIIDGLGYSVNDVSWGEVDSIKEQTLGDNIVNHIKENGYLE